MTLTSNLARIIEVGPHHDHRGAVRETFRQSWLPDLAIAQLVQSDSKQNVLRGMHLHRRQTDVWRFTHGSALVRLYDPATDTNELIDTGKHDIVLAIPPGIAHGFYTPIGCTLVYALTEEYDGTDEYGFFPLDGIEDDRWPVEHRLVNLSLRDLRAPRLTEFLAA